MAVRATKGTSPIIDRWFDCGQWDAMPTDKNGWAVVSVDCVGQLPWSRRPWAEAFKYPPNSYSSSGNITVEGNAPIFVSNTNGNIEIYVQSSDVLAGSSKLTVTNGGDAVLGPDDVSVDVVEANLSLQNLGGLLLVGQINPTGSSAGQVITNVGGVPTWAAPASGYTDEQAQDAVGLNYLDTDTVDMVYTDATPSFSANVRMQMSLTSDGSGIRLSGDSATPGNTRYYGTDGAGTKGWYDLVEVAQDAVGNIIVDSDTVDFGYNDGTPSITAVVRLQMSVTSDTSGVKLVNDQTTPGVTKYYGTDGAGAKGWHTLSIPAAYTDEQAQDAVGNFIVDTNTIDMVYTDATPSFAANVRLQMSLTSDASGVRLVNDAAAPGNSFYYGTNGSGTKGYFALPVAASKWTDGTGGSIYRNSNVAIGNAITPTARLTIDGAGAIYPIIAYTNNATAAWNIFSNTNTTTTTGLALSQNIDGTNLNFTLQRYGSTHATTPNRAEIRQQSNAEMAFYTNAAERVIIAAGGAVTVLNLGGTGNRLVQADSAGVLSRSTLDPATLSAYTFENGLTNTTGVVRWGGTLTQATTITQSTFAIRFTGNFFGLHRTTNNPTNRATFTLDGLNVAPVSITTPSEDALFNIHGTSAGTQVDAQLSIGADPTATNGLWMQGRAITSYNTFRPIKMQPRGGKEVHGAYSNFDPQFTFAGSGLTTTVGALTSVTLHVCNTGESGTRPKISLGTNNTFLAGISHDSTLIASRFFCMSASGSVRFGVGNEDADKVVIMNGGAGRLGAGFATTTGLHSTMQSSGSIAAAILSSVAAPTVDEAKHTMIYTNSTPVTYTLPTSSTCIGRIYVITNHGTSTVTISPAVSRGGATFNTLTQGQWCWIQAQAAGWVGFKLTSL